VTSEAEEIQNLLNGKSKVRLYVGTFVGLVNRAATVDLVGGRVTGMSTATPYRPQVNDTVWVAFIDGVPLMLGPTVMPPDSGTVVTVSPETAVVTTDVGDIRATYNVGAAISSGQTVKLMWAAGAHIVGVMSSSPTPPTPPPPPVIINPVPHIDVFTAVTAGSWSEAYGWAKQEPWAADNVLGAWFYGSKIRDTLAGAAIQRIELFATPTQVKGAAPAFATHLHAAKPPGSPLLSNPTPIAVGPATWIELPVEFGQFLLDNIGGIGLNHGGENKFRSLAEDPQSGAIRITSIY
jgi:hypothetical protein